MASTMTLWQPSNQGLVPSGARTPKSIAKCATQLSDRDQRQIVSAFKSGHYDMGLNFLWLRTVAALKRELATVGLGLLGEMLGRVGVDEEDDIEDLLTPRDTIRLAEELGAISRTEAMRLRQTHELVTHFNQLSIEEDPFEEIDEAEAISSLRACVSAVLAKPKIEVAKTFVEFRESLETEAFGSDAEKLQLLIGSPYFFWKLTIDILMNSVKDSSGVKLEHCLANLNVILPKLWPNLKDAEKWRVGRTYAEVHSEGKATSSSGLKRALMKVQGFDFVPESLRSDTFVKAAEAIMRAHDGMNNFHNEGAPTRNLSQLGTSIPPPALPACMTALLAVYLGNQYGHSFDAAPVAEKVLSAISEDRWRYYLNHVLSSDTKILNKLASYSKPRERWIILSEQHSLTDAGVNDRRVARMLDASQKNDEPELGRTAKKLLGRYYRRT